jgi:hypothetical protein
MCVSVYLEQFIEIYFFFGTAGSAWMTLLRLTLTLRLAAAWLALAWSGGRRRRWLPRHFYNPFNTF